MRCQALYVCCFTYNTAKPWVKYYPHLHFYYPGREVKWAQRSDPGWAWNPTPGAVPPPWRLLSKRRPCSSAGCSKNLLILVANISNLISDHPGPNIQMSNYFWYDFFLRVWTNCSVMSLSQFHSICHLVLFYQSRNISCDSTHKPSVLSKLVLLIASQISSFLKVCFQKSWSLYHFQGLGKEFSWLHKS